MKWNFPLARRGWAAGMRLRASWLVRHQHPVNFYLHLAGIPLGFAGVGLLLLDLALTGLGYETPLPAWYWLLGVSAVGYLLQFAGHAVEGNDVGELIPVKRALGLPVVEVGPRAAAAAESANPPSPR